MATKTARKPVAKKATQAKAGAGPAIAEHSKDAKPKFGKAAPKKVTPAAAKPAVAKVARASKPKSEKSIAARVVDKVKETASGAVSFAASVLPGKSKKSAKAKS